MTEEIVSKHLAFKKKCREKYGDPNITYQLTCDGGRKRAIVFVDMDEWLTTLMCPSCDFSCRNPLTMIEHIKTHSFEYRVRKQLSRVSEYLHLGYARSNIIDNFKNGWISKKTMLEQLDDLEECIDNE